MGARLILLRWYVRLTRSLPPWIKSRRARLAAFAALAALALGLIADLGDSISFLFPGPKPATSAEIRAMQTLLVEELRARGVSIDAPAQTAFQEAVEYFQTADDPRGRRAIELLDAFEPERALALFTLIAEDAATRRRKAPTEAARAYEALGAIAYAFDRARALAAYEKAREFTPDDSYISLRLGQLYSELGAIDEAAAANDRTISLARAEGDPVRAAQAGMNNGLIAKRRGEIETAKRALIEAAAVFDAHGARYDLGLVYVNLGSVYLVAPISDLSPPPDTVAADEHFQAALAIGYDLRDPLLVAGAHLGLGKIAIDRNHYTYAFELLGRALAHAEWINEPDLVAQIRTQLAVASLVVEDMSSALHHITLARDIYRTLNDPAGLGATMLALGSIKGALGDGVGGCADIEAGLAMVKAAGGGAYADFAIRSLPAGCTGDAPVQNTAPAAEMHDVWSPDDEIVPSTPEPNIHSPEPFRPPQ